jgi:hypothetical protein
MEISKKFMNEVVRQLASTDGRVHSPWVALGERYISAVRVVRQDVAFLSVGEQHRDEYTKLEVARLILDAQVYLWRPKVFDTIQHCPLPDHIVSDSVLPFPTSYHTFEIRYEYRPDQIDTISRYIPSVPADIAYEWMLMVDRRDHFDLLIFVSSMGNPAWGLLICFPIKYHARYPEEFPKDAKDVGGVLGMLAFLKSPDKHIEQHRIPRSIRRGTQLGDTPASQSVSVVTLKRAVHDAIKSAEGRSVEWKHHWWVSGHMRAQWYPSKGSHEVTFIAPYLKGPVEKPLLQKVYDVAKT